MSPSMAAQPDGSLFAPQPHVSGTHSFLRKLLGRPSRSASSSPGPAEGRDHQQRPADDVSKPGLIRRMSRKVVPGLPRNQTFKRQQSERRQHLAPVEPTPEERRAVSVDRRSHRATSHSHSQARANPRASAPSVLGDCHLETASQYAHSLSIDDEPVHDDVPETAHYMSDELEETYPEFPPPDAASMTDARSMTTSQYDAMIHDELEKTWILNLSMHFRDRSKREKFFVTYREHEHLWRRVTVSLDYRDAPENSLEKDLIRTKYQRDKSAKIYEAIRESLSDIQFYDTVTNLKLETTDGRLHVHVVEDGNEIIHYPAVGQVRHLGCRRVKERDIVFDSHMSGFVYKVGVQGHVLIKKEIPSPDTVEEFLYEVNALDSLRFSNNVIKLYGVVVDDNDEYVKGLLISYADKGALIDIIYENCKENNTGLPWSTREKWARQIVQGLADIHESGFVQGDFTLSNIVIDDAGDAMIIDINRRGCPVGWEPPEATALIESNQRLSMYIGVKSDLYQLGMVLWGLATLEDEPEAQGRPLVLGPEINVPDWFRQMTEICLGNDPRMRLQASSLLQMFPRVTAGNNNNNSNNSNNGVMHPDHEPISVDGQTLHEYLVDGYNANPHGVVRTVEPANGWPYSAATFVDNGPLPYDPHYYARGRSPPSPLPSNYDGRNSPRDVYYKSAWAANRDIAPSYSDSGDDNVPPDNDYEVSRQPTPTPTADNVFVVGLENLHVADLSQPIAQEDAECPASVDAMGNSAVGTAVATKNSTLLGASEPVSRSSVASAVDGKMNHGGTDVKATKEAIDSGYVKIESKDVDEKPDGVVNTRHVKTEKSTPKGDGKGSGSNKEEETAGTDHVGNDGYRQGPSEAEGGKKVDLKSTLPSLTGTNQEGHGTVNDAGPSEMSISIQKEEFPLEQQQETEAEPEYVTSQIPGTTAPDAQKNNMSPEQLQTQQMLRARFKDTIPTPYICPRQASIPVSLAGIGAAHMGMGMDGELLREKGVMDDDFNMLALTETTPATLMITTDVKT